IGKSVAADCQMKTPAAVRQPLDVTHSEQHGSSRTRLTLASEPDHARAEVHAAHALDARREGPRQPRRPARRVQHPLVTPGGDPGCDFADFALSSLNRQARIDARNTIELPLDCPTQAQSHSSTLVLTSAGGSWERFE